MSSPVLAPITNSGTVWTTNQTTQTGTAFTPNASRILLAEVFLLDTSSVSSITGHGTWSKIVGTTGSGSRNLELWGCKVGGSPSSVAVTVNFTTSRGKFKVFECAADYSAATVAAAIVQASSVSDGYHSTATTYPSTLASFADATNNAQVYCIGIPGAAASITATGGLAGGSPDPDYFEGTSYSLYLNSKVGENTTPTVSSTSTNDDHIHFAIELDYVGSGGGGGSASGGRLTLLGVG